MYTYGTNLVQTSEQMQNQPAQTDTTSNAGQPSNSLATPTPNVYDTGGATDVVNSGLENFFKSAGDNPIVKGIGNIFSPILNSGVGTALQNVLGTAQRGALSLAAPVLGKLLNIN